ncbi:MAG: hypothetical protein RIQ60_1282 [Pseudomonadota bacterium]|jgi:hypothetical protein
MNERYAMDPAAPADWKELKLLLDQFGLQTGRFLARYPQDWPAQMVDALGGTSDLERQRVREMLQRRKGVLMPSPAPFEMGTAWAGNAAVALDRHRAFAGVVGARSNGFGWPSAEDVLYDEAKALPVGQGDHLPMKASAYAVCFAPLMVVSAEVTLVDPYFTLRDRNRQRCRWRWPVMQALLRTAEASRTCEKLRLVFERTQIDATAGSDAQLEADLGRACDEAQVSKVTIEFDVLDDVGHGRYLLSIHGGLQFDRGFEERNNEKNHVHWLTRPELEPLWRRFLPSTNLSAPVRR